MTSCIVGKKVRAMGPGPLELFPFVVLAILMAMAGGISEDMLTSWSSFWSYGPFSTLRNGFRSITFEKISELDSYFIHKHIIINYRSSLI